MKKVVILHPAHWEQAMGGAELQISYLAKSLKKHNFDVHFIYEDKGSEISNKLGIKLHPLKKINIKKTLGQRWFLYKKKIISQLNEINPDVIYTRFFSSWSGFAAEYAAKNEIKHIWAIAHDTDVGRIQKKVSIFRLFDKIENKFVIKAFNKASYILTQNKFQQQLLYKNYHRTGVRINQMTEECKEADIKKNKNPILVVWVANLKQIKRPELFTELARSFENVRSINFTMVGRSNEKYQKLIAAANRLSNFQYLGELKNTEVNKILLQSHILINTSEYEGFSNTFVQAWMRKVIVISMNSNPDDIITEQKIGFMCPTVNDMKDKVEFLIKNPDIRQNMAQKAYDYAVKNHSLDKNINKVISLMK
jgi:glycosyltransferase involved in cell wall biosynthesis